MSAARLPGRDDGQALPIAAAPVLLRRARPADIPALAALINDYARQGLLLPRTAEQLARDIDSFTVAVDGHGVAGCGSLRVYTPTLAELCALAVARPWQGRGVGRSIVESIADEAEGKGITQLFALTLEERFFNRLGFRTGRIADVPEKVWADCEGCPVRHACREIMVVRELTSAR